MTQLQRSILIVEDHEQVRRSLAELLGITFPNLSIFQVDSAEKAIADMAQTAHELVIMDINLPQMTGIQATKHIQDNHPATKVVVLTNHEEQFYREQAMAAGAKGFVQKRTMHRTLLPILQELLN